MIGKNLSNHWKKISSAGRARRFCDLCAPLRLMNFNMKQVIFEGLTNVTKKVYATPAFEMKETLLNPAETNRANWQWEMAFCRIYVDTPAGKIGIYQEEGRTNGVGLITRSYIHKDYLGSVIAVSDDSSNITFYSYDAWGQNRDPDDWTPLSDPITDNSELVTDRGFTGHEMLSGLDLIHMNGRIYDPVIGKMISPDPNIQSPDNLQSFNRYAYVFNNPLSYTDPSGFITSGLEMVMGSGRYTRSGGSGGIMAGGIAGDDGGGDGDSAFDYENYCEPIESAEETAARDKIHAMEQEMREADPNVTIGNYGLDVQYDTAGSMSSAGGVEPVVSSTGDDGGSGGKLSTEADQSAGNDLSDNGLGTGGGSADLPGHSKEMTTGVDAADTELSDSVKTGSTVQKGKQSDNPAGDAVEGGNKGNPNFTPPGNSDAERQAEGVQKKDSKLAAGLLLLLTPDIATPDPSDAAWQKWALYGSAVGAAWLLDRAIDMWREFKGEPGSTSSDSDGTRRFGEDGYPHVDVDYPHNHNPDVHAHDWGRPSDGGPPTAGDRGPSRPVTPNDPLLP